MKWDRFVLWLRKLGILRFGGYSITYKGRDIPIQVIDDDVIDPEKDLMFHCELGKKKEKEEEKGEEN